MNFSSNFAGGNLSSNFQTRANPFQGGFNTGMRGNSNGSRGASNRGSFGASDSNFRGSNPRPTNREVNTGAFGNPGGRRGGPTPGGSFARPIGPGNFGAPPGNQGPPPAFGNPWGMNSNPRQNSGSRSGDRGSRGARSNSSGSNMGPGPRQTQSGSQNPWSGTPNVNNFGNNFDARQTSSPNQNSNFGRQNSKTPRIQSRPTGSKHKGAQQSSTRTGGSFGPQGQSNSNFGTSSTGFGVQATLGFNQPTSTGFGQTAPGFGQPPVFGFPQASSGFSQPSTNFGQPQSNFQQQTQNFSRIGRGRGGQPNPNPNGPSQSPQNNGFADATRSRGRTRGDRSRQTNFDGRGGSSSAFAGGVGGANSGGGFDGGAFVSSEMMNELERGGSQSAGGREREPAGRGREERGERAERGRRGGRGIDARGDAQVGSREPRGRGRDQSNPRGGRGRDREDDRRGSNNRDRGRDRGGSKPGQREGGALALRIKKNPNAKPARGKNMQESEQSGSNASEGSEHEDSRSYSGDNANEDSYSGSDGYGDLESEGSRDYSSDRDSRNHSGSETPPSPPRRKPSNPYKDDEKQPNIHQRIVVGKGSKPGAQGPPPADVPASGPANPRLRVRTSTAVAATLKKFVPPPPPISAPDQPIVPLRRTPDYQIPRQLTEVSSHLLAKVQAYSSRAANHNDKTVVLYKLYLQKRKKRTLETNNRELIALLNKLEKIDLTYTDCFGMCPTKEINDRQNRDVDPFERAIGAEGKTMAPEKAVKRFSRSAADLLLDVPELLRPPYVLAKTLDYLWDSVVDDDLKETTSFIAPHERERLEYLDAFVFSSDRLRSVKQDMGIIQSHGKELCCSKPFITIYEQIARFYILSCNDLVGTTNFDPKMALDELTKTLTPLIECYQFARKKVKEVYSTSVSASLDPEEVDKIQEIVYISPAEPDFVCYNLLIMYFGQPAQFHSSIGKALRDHPELEGTTQFNTLLAAVSCLEKKNYPKYLKMISDQEDVVMASVMALPQFLAIVRISYFDIIKRMDGCGSSLLGASGQMDTESLAERTITFQELRTRLGLKTDQDLKWMLKFFYGKNSDGFNLYDEARQIVFLESFTKSAQELRGMLDKHKPFKILPALASKLVDNGKRIMRSTLIKGSFTRKNISEYVEQVHEGAFSTVPRMTDLMDTLPQESLKVPTPKAAQTALSIKDRISAKDSKSDSSLGKPDTSGVSTIDTGAKPAIPQLTPFQVKKKLSEEELELLAAKTLKRKQKARLNVYFTKWHLLSLAHNEQQAKVLEEHLSEKIFQSKQQSLLSLLSYAQNKKMVRDSLNDPETYFKGGLEDVEAAAEPFEHTTCYRDYNCFQFFVLELFNTLLRKWFDYLSPQLVIYQNFSQLRTFELEVLVVRDSFLHEGQYSQISSIFGVFLFKSEAELRSLLKGKRSINKLYYLEGWTDSSGIEHHGTFVLSITFRCQELGKVTTQDIKSASLVMHLNTDPINARAVQSLTDSVNNEQRKLGHSLYNSQLRSFYFGSLSHLLTLAEKKALVIQPALASSRLSIITEGKKDIDLVWQPFNGQLNNICETAYLSALQKTLQGALESVDHLLFSPKLASVKMAVECHQWKVSECFHQISEQLRIMEVSRSSCSFEDDRGDDKPALDFTVTLKDSGESFLGTFGEQLPLGFSGLVRTCLTRKPKGLLLVKNMLLAVIKNVQFQNWYTRTPIVPDYWQQSSYHLPKETVAAGATLAQYLRHLVDALQSNLLQEEVMGFESVSSKVYYYLERLVIEPFRLLRRSNLTQLTASDITNLENVVKPLILSEIVPLLQVKHNIGSCRCNWLTLFERTFILITRIWKVLEDTEEQQQRAAQTEQSKQAQEEESPAKKDQNPIGCLSLLVRNHQDHGLHDLFRDSVSPQDLTDQTQRDLARFKKSHDARMASVSTNASTFNRISLRDDELDGGEDHVPESDNQPHRRGRRSRRHSSRPRGRDTEELIPGMFISPIKRSKKNKLDPKVELESPQDFQLVIRRSSEDDFDLARGESVGLNLQPLMESDGEFGQVESFREEVIDETGSNSSSGASNPTNTPSEAATEDPWEGSNDLQPQALGKRIPRLLYSSTGHNYSLTSLLLRAGH